MWESGGVVFIVHFAMSEMTCLLNLPIMHGWDMGGWFAPDGLPNSSFHGWAGLCLVIFT